ncbi:MAG: hypothetical protein ACYCX7_03095 [Solirubrobacteraceae bacterium]
MSDWLEATESSASMSALSERPIDGGVSSPGAGESEVLLDVDTVMFFNPLPGTRYVVYDAPPSTSFQTIFNAIAVGGSSIDEPKSELESLSYARERWWNGAGETPATGAGGFGVSRYFARPAYQEGETEASMRSVPDVVMPADPRDGVLFCQADAGGCPGDQRFGGTSFAAPLFAALMSLGHGMTVSSLYTLGEAPGVFHDAEAWAATSPTSGSARSTSPTCSPRRSRARRVRSAPRTRSRRRRGPCGHVDEPVAGAYAVAAAARRVRPANGSRPSHQRPVGAWGAKRMKAVSWWKGSAAFARIASRWCSPETPSA